MAYEWLGFAEKELGQAEVHGEQDNPRILEYHKSTTLKATNDETPWCAAFVCWCLQEAGIQSTHSAAAKSYLLWGKELKEPKYGCIVILKRGDSAWQGHVGFYVGQGENYIKVLGGNQGDRVSIENFNKAKVLGYRWPKETK